MNSTFSICRVCFSDVLRDRSGQFALAGALLALPIALAVGLAVDTANVARARSHVRSALDAASMAMAVKVPSNLSDPQLEALGNDFFKTHLDPDFFPDGSLPSLHYLGLSVDEAGVQHMQAEVSFDYALTFSGVFGSANLADMIGANLYLMSEVSVRPAESACVYALSRTAPRAIEAAGNTTIAMDGCVLAANSSAADAIYVGGSAALEADCLQSSGGIVATAGLTLDCASAREDAWPLPDPFASIPEPVPPILFANPSSQATTMSAGRYRNLSLDGDITLAPGLYYVEGDLAIKGVVRGEGVTFFMKDGGVTVNGNASLVLSAPESGTYAGMLFMGSQTNYSSHLFNGTGDTELNGYLYFPKGKLTYTGNNATASTCLRIVADTIVMSGSSVLKSDCTDELGGREAKVSGPLHFTR